ncbi:MAG: usg protein [Elstera sp.]
MNDLSLQLRDYRLTTAEILYHMPDHPGLLQTFIWQHLDIAPRFPELKKFLDFWTHSLDGKLHSVRVAAAEGLSPGHWKAVEAEFRLH